MNVDAPACRPGNAGYGCRKIGTKDRLSRWSKGRRNLGDKMMLKRSHFGIRSWIVIFSLMGWCFYSGSVRAAIILETGSVINGYRACAWRDNGNGTSTLSMVVDFKKGFNSNNGFGEFLSRGFLVYTYDKGGKMKPSGATATNIRLNGVLNLGRYIGNDYVMYYGNYPDAEVPRDQWIIKSPFSANVEVLIDNSRIADWPAVSVRAGNFTISNDIGEITGAAYFSRYDGGTNCKVIDPEVPPPPAIGISVTAPDWNLGELPEGTADKVLSGSSNQICFTYQGAAVSGKQFIINAGNANGIAGNQYSLKNLNDATQLVPYSVKLDSGSSTVSLPNASKVALTLNSAGKTCFVPTFRTTVGAAVKAGDYSDVLTFTVVTKS
ncbi:hypothetical protein [Burkholderia cepacia]|uniref:hypothetical protein n=1 Tax=Burkholderia cepacia TaxID=292 RepID=UPI0012D8FA9A|nr:hypothetical protein [Burkholderia cepacia]